MTLTTATNTAANCLCSGGGFILQHSIGSYFYIEVELFWVFQLKMELIFVSEPDLFSTGGEHFSATNTCCLPEPSLGT